MSAGAGLNATQSGDGFELLRQLASESSLHTRSEALALRAAFAMKSFQLSAQGTSPSSVVTDTILTSKFLKWTGRCCLYPIAGSAVLLLLAGNCPPLPST